MAALITDPNHESPDVIDQRDPNDPSHFDPKPGEPSVTPGITLPTTIPDGWTIDENGAMVPLAEPTDPPVTVLPEITITGTAPSSSGWGLPLFLGACAVVVGFFVVRSLK